MGAPIDAGKRIWAIVNSSLILPLLLALGVMYVAFGAIVEERGDLSKDQALLSQERTAIVNSISQQNAALSRDVVELTRDQLADRQALAAKRSNRR
jgi:hypothetical protein